MSLEKVRAHMGGVVVGMRSSAGLYISDHLSPDQADLFANQIRQATQEAREYEVPGRSGLTKARKHRLVRVKVALYKMSGATSEAVQDFLRKENIWIGIDTVQRDLNFLEDEGSVHVARRQPYWYSLTPVGRVEAHFNV